MTRTTQKYLRAGAASVMLSAALILGTPAQGTTVYQYEDANGNSTWSGGQVAGVITNIGSTYNVNTEAFTWRYDITTIPGSSSHADLFWLVVSAGPQPDSNNSGVYAILYGDLNTGTTYAEVYENTRNPVGDFIHAFPGSISVTSNLDGTQSVSVAIDATVINSFGGSGWVGLQYGPNIGAWFHPFSGSFTFDGSDVTALSKSIHSWFDVSDRTTTVVPLPAALWLLLSGLASLVAMRRRTEKARFRAIPAAA